MQDLLALLQDPNIRWILLACMLLGISSGVIGCFAYLRKQSLVGDALAHAALPGVCIAFMLSGSKSMLLFMIGAGAAGLIATFGIGYITRNTKIKQDSALGIILSVFFAIGVVFLTIIQQSPYGNQAGLDTFLLGQAAAMVLQDVYVMVGVSIFLVGLCALLFKEFKLLSFDPGFARGLGLPVAFLDQLVMFLIVVAVVVGIKAVGVVLMAALLITPAVAARYWTDHLGWMVTLAGIFGAVSGAAGTLISASAKHLPTGPLSVLSATAIFAFSALLSPKRGLIVKLWNRRINKRRFLASTSAAVDMKEG